MAQHCVYKTTANGNTCSSVHSIPKVTPFLAALTILYDGPGHTRKRKHPSKTPRLVFFRDTISRQHGLKNRSNINTAAKKVLPQYPYHRTRPYSSHPPRHRPRPLFSPSHRPPLSSPNIMVSTTAEESATSNEPPVVTTTRQPLAPRRAPHYRHIRRWCRSTQQITRGGENKNTHPPLTHATCPPLPAPCLSHPRP